MYCLPVSPWTVNGHPLTGKVQLFLGVTADFKSILQGGGSTGKASVSKAAYGNHSVMWVQFPLTLPALSMVIV